MDFERGKRVRPQFTIRLLLGCLVLVSFSIAAFQYAWPRRTLNTRIVLNSMDVQILEPYLESIQSSVPSVSELQVDRSTNSLVFRVQARDMVSATKLVKEKTDELFGGN